MQNKRTLTLAHAIIISLIMFVIFSALQALGLLNLFRHGYAFCSWIGLIALSITIAWCFNKQPGIIQFFIFVFIAVFLLFLYTLVAQINPDGIPYINAMGMGICCVLFVCIIYVILSQSKNDKKKETKSELDELQRLIQAIYKGRYSSREDLFRFYLNYTSKKVTFIDLLNAICDVCMECSSNENFKSQIREECKVVYSIVNPILDEEREFEYLSCLNGKDRDSLLNLHKNMIDLESMNRENVIQNISYIADTIVSLQQKLKEENKRNTQALTISIVGILLTIIFSLLSFLVADKYYAIHAYLDYIK